MKRRSADAKLIEKRAAWLERTMEILSVDEATARSLLSLERQQSIRVNPLRVGPDFTLHAAWVGEQYSWMPEGYTLAAPVAAIRDDPLIAEGQLFIQNAASWLPVLALDPKAGDTILDACAAPGGKTSHIAAVTNNQATIWANDNSRPRLGKLQATMERLNAHVSRYTLFDATQLSRKLDGQLFDKILLDAPCSGEGLMNLDSNRDLATWSVAHIKRLQQLQKRLIIETWRLLRPGGTLVYSTCTMAPEENEAVIDYLLRKHPDAQIVPYTVNLSNRVTILTSWNGKAYDPRLQNCIRLAPSPQIEAFFVCKLEKLATTSTLMV